MGLSAFNHRKDAKYVYLLAEAGIIFGPNDGSMAKPYPEITKQQNNWQTPEDDCPEEDITEKGLSLPVISW